MSSIPSSTVARPQIFISNLEQEELTAKVGRYGRCIRHKKSGRVPKHLAAWSETDGSKHTPETLRVKGGAYGILAYTDSNKR